MHVLGQSVIGESLCKHALVAVSNVILHADFGLAFWNVWFGRNFRAYGTLNPLLGEQGMGQTGDTM